MGTVLDCRRCRWLNGSRRHRCGGARLGGLPRLGVQGRLENLGLFTTVTGSTVTTVTGSTATTVTGSTATKTLHIKIDEALRNPIPLTRGRKVTKNK